MDKDDDDDRDAEDDDGGGNHSNSSINTCITITHSAAVSVGPITLSEPRHPLDL